MSTVLFLINNLNRGGAEHAFVRQINMLHREGVPVCLGLLHPGAPDGYERELAIPASAVIRFKQDASKFWQVHALVRRHNVRVVYSTLELPNIIARLLKLTNPRLRVYIREGSALVTSRGGISPKPIKFRLFDIFINWVPHNIIAVSPQIARALASYQPMYAHKITVLENGIPVEESYEEVRSRAESKRTRQEFKVLAVASMNYHERSFEYLIDALPLLPSELLARTTLTFAGDGSLRPMYEAQVAKLGLQQHVRFLGRIDSAALNNEYREADAFVMCSTAEGSPNVIVEAMAHGVPVVATRAGSAVSMVVDQETGFFIPFKDAHAIAEKLQWLADHPYERVALGMAGYMRAQTHYSLTQVVKTLRHLLHI